MNAIVRTSNIDSSRNQETSLIPPTSAAYSSSSQQQQQQRQLPQKMSSAATTLPNRAKYGNTVTATPASDNSTTTSRVFVTAGATSSQAKHLSGQNSSTSLMRQQPNHLQQASSNSVFDRLHKLGTCSSASRQDHHSCFHCLRTRILANYRQGKQRSEQISAF